jgi:hypothetical protein
VGDNIRKNLEEIVWGAVYWIGLSQDRDQWRFPAYTVINLEAL